MDELKKDHEDSHVEDDGSESSDSCTESRTTSSPEESTRNELLEMKKMTREETKKVKVWREVVTGVLVITAAFMATATYVVLNREENKEFLSAVRVFSLIDSCVLVQSAKREYSKFDQASRFAFSTSLLHFAFVVWSGSSVDGSGGGKYRRESI